MRTRAVSIILVAVAVSAAVYYFREQPAARPVDGNARVPAAAVFDAAADQPVADKPVAGAIQSASVDYRIFEPPGLDGNTADRIASVEAVFRQAESGSADAQYEVAGLLMTCNGLMDESFPYRLKFLEQQGRPAWYLDKLQEDANACRDMPFYNLETTEPAYWLERAKNAGNAAALAEYLGMVADVNDLSGADALAAKVLLAKNGDAYYKLIPYLVHRDQHMGIYDNKYDAARSGAMLQLACHFGFRECEPDSRMVRELCVNAVPMCVPDMGMLEYMQRFEWTTEEAQLYEVLFQQYLEAIEQGDVALIFADS